uniref:Large ribosomal subunit protein uL23m n=1 Tax=Ciona savignyi TaxID=51511 RepID=H2Y9C9_CIOSA
MDRFPLHYDGAPQRRIFIPEWYITMVKPRPEMPKNYVRFHVPADMTKYDVKEYLDKIYNVSVMSVHLSVVGYIRYRYQTPWKTDKYMWKFMEPWKIAHIYLGKNETFEFPDVLTKPADDLDDDDLSDASTQTKVEQYEQYSKYTASQKNEPEGLKNKVFFENKWL